MKCHYCGGEMKKEKTSYSVNKLGYHLIIDDINAWICSQCGETYFEGEVIDAIQDVIESTDKGITKVKDILLTAQE